MDGFGVEWPVIVFEPGLAGLGQRDAGWRVEIADRPVGWPFIPADIEGTEPAEELHTCVVGQMVVNPPAKRLPVAGALIMFDIGRNDYGRSCAEKPLFVAHVPDVMGGIVFIAGAPAFGDALRVKLMAVGVERRRTIGAAYGDVAKGFAQRFQYQLAELFPSGDRAIGAFGNIGHAVEIADLAIEHVAHEEVIRKAMAAQFGEIGQGADAVPIG